METFIDTSKSSRINGHILVDRTKAMELVDQLRLAVPKEVRAAEEVLGPEGPHNEHGPDGRSPDKVHGRG